MERTSENINQKKESFILYLEQLKILDELTDEEAGILFKTIKNYVYTGTTPELQKIIKIAFLPIQNQLKMDLKKWRDIKEKRVIAGSQGGKKRQAKQANANFAKQNQANQAVNVNVNVNENDTVNVNDSVFNETLNDFRDMRKKIKKPLTKRAEELLINNLNKITTNEDEQIKILEQSIVHCWQDVYKLKDNKDCKSKYDSLVIEESEVIDV